LRLQRSRECGKSFPMQMLGETNPCPRTLEAAVRSTVPLLAEQAPFIPARRGECALIGPRWQPNASHWPMRTASTEIKSALRELLIYNKLVNGLNIFSFGIL